MIPCPIAYWKKQRPEAFAIDLITYSQLDEWIQSLSEKLIHFPEEIIAFTPQYRPLDVALFFAIWRVNKAAYPLNFRLPKKAIKQRLILTGAKWFEPSIGKEKLELSELDEIPLATLIETSSSKKIVCHSLKSLVISCQSATQALGLKQESRYCLNLPLFHIAGIATCLRSFLAGATLLTQMLQN